MNYQPQNDLIDPDVPPGNAVLPELDEQDPGAPNDAYVIGERFNTVQAPDAARRRKSAGSGRRRWLKPAAVLSAALCIGLTGWNLSRLVSGPPAPPKPSPFQLKQALYLGAMKVEAYRRVHAVTPDRPEDIGLSNPPYSYRRVSPTQYTLALDGPGSRLEYDSDIPLERFFGTPREMLKMGGSR
jgi:hypothetical protein